MLKDPAEIALNDLHVALRKAADQYDHALGVATNPELTKLFRELAEQRRRMADVLEEHIRRIGLPRMPHSEKEGLEKLATRLKAAVSADQDSALLKDQRALEQAIATACVASLQHPLSDETRAVVQDIAQCVVADQDRFSHLEELRSAEQG